MFKFSKQAFISLATKHLSLNNEPGMNRNFLIYLNQNELHY